MARVSRTAKKQYANIRDDGTIPEINAPVAPAPKKSRKPRAPKASPSPVKTAVKKRKANALKPRLSETMTFGTLISDYDVSRNSGFIYLITLTHVMAPGCTYTYIGKKGFSTGSDWRYYQSSSAKVMEKLNSGWEASYSVISLQGTLAELNRAEGSRIVRQWLHSTDRASNLNMGVVLQGVKWSRYKYCKKYLNVIDRSY